ncbi:putative TonB-dependent receptor BfrD precursor [Variibacter gotjawalensis]|uniref:Putative TonB-dependent receptor BfrD n=1 Tax=Variibacter gotjawalensis TaxID=1333996 RepID=A0A0S3PX72_9BRAD|nr:TonB-dependent siderophore receptor [Variibacter gotjawalensis]NIK46363.1 catecholate siderophore receptor [Variibacter gotjawalensis]RZS48273.1 catecholate siderophore receptor [Variibacter gotjawalensis]BAT60533.1 putative TonB-dependent receptor BfrD precursor [Variibacter gotjawalensis]
MNKLPIGMGAISATAFLCLLEASTASAQSTQPAASQPSLPTVSVQAPRQQVVRRAPRRRVATRPVSPRVAPPAPVPVVATEGVPRTASGGTTVGYATTRITSGTKTDTPIINVPQSATVLTKEFIQDQSVQFLGEATRYVPGVIWHQGEGNRDDLVIRGQRSNADFYVNGFRDDVQYFRDLYNVERVEVLKGPNALIFGRGGGGGIVNRVLKEPEWRNVPYGEVTLSGGQYNDRRATLDVGGALNGNVAGRFDAMYEKTDSYRNHVGFERWGINPMFAFRLNDQTKVTLSYEHYDFNGITDRGIPSQFGRPYKTDVSTFFGNPDYARTYSIVDSAMAVIEHETDSGVKIRNGTRYANYDRWYQNVFPGGAVNNAGTSVNLSAYNNRTDRENIFNQTDVTWKFNTGSWQHTALVGGEVGHQSGLSYRETGLFNGVSTALAVNPLNPTVFGPITFKNNGTTDANSTYRLGLGAVYIQDQIEVTRWLQLIAGVRFDHFDLEATNRTTNLTFGRIDNVVSPRGGIVIKPQDNMSIYASYSVSHLPSSGDQFSSLTPGLVISEPEKFENKEVGFKWEIMPRLLFSTAIFELDRTNQRLPDPNNAGFFLLSGRTLTRGFEAGLAGYITDEWQVAGGYAYTDARIASNVSATVVAGNRVGLVPYNTFSLWNRYQFHPRWGVGVGIIHYTDSYASSDDTVRLPGWTRVDAAVYYKVSENIRAQINIENIFDKGYFSTADGNNNITPGAPRTVRAALTAKF